MIEVPDFLRPEYVPVISEKEIENKKLLDAKYEEYYQKFGDYPDVPTFNGDDDELIECLDMCIESGITYYDLFLADMSDDDDI